MKANYEITIKFQFNYEGRKPNENEALKTPEEIADEIGQQVCDDYATPDLVALYDVIKSVIVVE